MGTSNRTLKQKAYHEFKEMLVITIYLWVFLALLALHKSVILAENHVDVVSQSFALLNALALAKVMLIARALHFAEFSYKPPLVYPTLVKAAAFSLLLACFKILEDAAIGLYRGKSFADSIADIGGGTWMGILSLTGIAFVALIPFFAFAELQELVGEGKLEQVFLHRRETLDLSGHPAESIGPTLEQQGAGKQASA